MATIPTATVYQDPMAELPTLGWQDLWDVGGALVLAAREADGPAAAWLRREAAAFTDSAVLLGGLDDE